MSAPEFTPTPELAAIIHRATAIARERGEDLYVVGGTVRDALLGRVVRDLDLAASGDAMKVSRALAADLGGHLVPLDAGRGIARVVLDRGPGNVAYLDVAQIHGSLQADLERRDFTINALAVEAGSRQIIDFQDGLGDLRTGVVRMTSADVFDDDPLRLLRAPRIAAELGFTIDASTQDAIRARAGALRFAAPERQRDELARIMGLDDACGGLRLLDDLGLLDVLLPELTPGKGMAQPEQWHVYDVFEHSLRAVEAMDLMLGPPAPHERAWLRTRLWEGFAWSADDIRTNLAEEFVEGRDRRALLKLAALLHDVGKPQVRTVDAGGRVRFLGHADEGASIAARMMRRLRFSAGEVRFVSKLVREHLRPVQLAQVGEAPTRRALYRFYRDLGDGATGVLLLALADAAASRGPAMTSEDWSRHVAYMNGILVRSVQEEGIVQPPRLLSGDDIIRELGVPAGPAIGELLEALREAQAAGDVRNAPEALAFVRRLASKPGPAGAGDR